MSQFHHFPSHHLLSSFDNLESSVYPGPLTAGLVFAIFLILLFSARVCEKSSSSFKITFGRTGFQHRVITVSMLLLTQPCECLAQPCKF